MLDRIQRIETRRNRVMVKLIPLIRDIAMSHWRLRRIFLTRARRQMKDVRALATRAQQRNAQQLAAAASFEEARATMRNVLQEQRDYHSMVSLVTRMLIAYALGAQAPASFIARMRDILDDWIVTARRIEDVRL